MEARKNFYSSIFEEINSYKNKEHDLPQHHGFMHDHILELGIGASALLLVMFSGVIFKAPSFSLASGGILSFFQDGLRAPERSNAAEVTFDGYPVRPTDDGYVISDSPQKSLGSESVLRASVKNPESHIYLKFRIPTSVPYTKATLSLSPRSNTSKVAVYNLPDMVWTENLLTFESRPTAGTEVIGNTVESDGRAVVDVTAAIKGKEAVSFILQAVSDPVSFASREAGSNLSPVIVLSE